MPQAQQGVEERRPLLMDRERQNRIARVILGDILRPRELAKRSLIDRASDLEVAQGKRRELYGAVSMALHLGVITSEEYDDWMGQADLLVTAVRLGNAEVVWSDAKLWRGEEVGQ